MDNKTQDEEVNVRMHHFSKKETEQAHRIMLKLQNDIKQNNNFYRQFKQICEQIDEKDAENFQIVLFAEVKSNRAGGGAYIANLGTHSSTRTT